MKYEELASEGRIGTIVKVNQDQGLILRNGAVKMRLPFQLGAETTGSYEMPLGRFEIAANTTMLGYNELFNKSEGSIRLVYDFTMQGSERRYIPIEYYISGGKKMNIVEQVQGKLKEEIKDAVLKANLATEDQIPDVILEIPKDKAHGDYSTNMAMQLAVWPKKHRE